MMNLLHNTLERQKTELKQYDNLKRVQRNLQQNLESKLDSPLVKAVIGPRRAGKSTLVLEALKHRKFAYVNFEDEGFAPNLTGDDMIAAIHKVYGDVDYFYFDEIQNFDRWEQFIHRLHRQGLNCILTGSNSRLLSEELSSALTGRHLLFELLPFSFHEAQSTLAGSTVKYFDTYLQQGGFPEVVLQHIDYKSYLTTLWDAVVLKDIVRRKKIRQVAALNDFLSLALSSIAAPISFDSLSKTLHGHASPPTIKKFLKYAQEAYLVCQLEQFYASPRKRIKSQRKIYVYDNGFFCARRVSVTADLGRLLENLVFQELVRRGYKPNLSLFYYQTSKGYEVDFLLRKDHLSVGLIQVCFDMSSLRTRDREIRSLKEAADDFGLKQVEIISYDLKEEFVVDGLTICVIPAQEWLSN